MTSPFVKYLLDMLSDLGDVRSRATFGGCGIYHDGVMIGLIASGVRTATQACFATVCEAIDKARHEQQFCRKNCDESWISHTLAILRKHLVWDDLARGRFGMIRK